MNGKERSRRPVRRGTPRGRQEPRRENVKGPMKRRERDAKNWTKKLEEGELDDLLVTGEDGEEGESWFDEDPKVEDFEDEKT